MRLAEDAQKVSVIQNHAQPGFPATRRVSKHILVNR